MSVAIRPVLSDTFNQKQLLNGFWIFVGILVLWAVLLGRPVSWAGPIGAALIAAAALWPTYLWCSGKAIGLPILPLFALRYLGAYGLPLLSMHEGIVDYQPQQQLVASITVAVFLCLATLAALPLVRTPPVPPKVLRMIDPKKGVTLFWGGLGVDIIYNLSIQAGWLNIPGGFSSTLKISVGILGLLSVFSLSYLWSQGKLGRTQSFALPYVIVVLVLIRIAGLLINNGVGVILSALIGYLLGKGKLTFRFILVFACILIFIGLLNYGKWELRAKYWQSGDRGLQPWDYPARYAEWTDNAFRRLSQSTSEDSNQTSELSGFGEVVVVQELFERGSLMHLLLLVQSKSPSELPFLNGVTYASLPELLIPRILNPDKVWSHEGNYILNIYYGLQSVTQVFQTTVGWGLLNEAYANFGFLGCGLLGLIVGSGYGFIARWSYGCPVFSARFMYAIMIMTTAFSTEVSASVIAASLSQVTFFILAIAFIVMKPIRVDPRDSK